MLHICLQRVIELIHMYIRVCELVCVNVCAWKKQNGCTNEICNEIPKQIKTKRRLIKDERKPKQKQKHHTTPRSERKKLSIFVLTNVATATHFHAAIRRSQSKQVKAGQQQQHR